MSGCRRFIVRMAYQRRRENLQANLVFKKMWMLPVKFPMIQLTHTKSWFSLASIHFKVPFLGDLMLGMGLQPTSTKFS